MKEYTLIEFLDIEENEEYIDLIQKVVFACLKEEELDQTNLYLNIILTGPEQIRQTNFTYRKIDKETDVLSFPMFEKAEVDKIKEDPQGILAQIKDVLGDIMISIPRVKEQATEYGHSVSRELSYMIVHGFYHIMGYDHIEEKDKVVMRQKEEKVLNQLHITREGNVD